MQKIILQLFIFLFTTIGLAEEYFVEPLVCKGKWNKQPPNYHKSYEYTALKVVSFKSVRAKDCSFANSTGTEAFFGDESQSININDERKNLGIWFSEKIYKDGNNIELPDGIWSGLPLNLEIIDSRIVNERVIDTLKGKYLIFDDYFYDLTCEAIVVKSPSHIENNTSNCKF